MYRELVAMIEFTDPFLLQVPIKGILVLVISFAEVNIHVLNVIVVVLICARVTFHSISRK